MKLLYTVCFFTIACAGLNAQNHISNPGKLSLEPQTSAAMLLSNNGMTHALIKVFPEATDSLLNAHGIIINSKFGNIWSIQLPVDRLNQLGCLSCIQYAEISSRANAARFKNDIERKATSVDKVQDGLNNGLPLNYSGKGVVVGIVDIGFQCNNPTFYTNDGSRTRIKRFWNQASTQGTPPPGYSYGEEITDTALVQLANDLDGAHGTHVAGIAAGSGFTTPNLQFRGMAPEADLVFVTIKYGNDTIGGSALGDYVVANPTILDAYRYIFDYAASVGKPAVINLSWGMHTGPHDGTSLFDQATETLVGKGRILVGANGNEGENAMHWDHVFNQDTAGTFMIENSREYRNRESVYVDFWGSANTDFSILVQIIDTNRVVVAQTPFISSTSDQVNVFNLTGDSSAFKIVMACEQKNPNNNKPNMTVMADHQNPRKYAIIAYITSANSSVHAWNSGATREWTSGSFRSNVGKLNYDGIFIPGNSDYTAGENGGTSPAVISVGAFAARSAYMNYKGKWVNDSGYVTPGNITGFSSKGPTVDGRIKPDVCAPGFDVPSSINNKQIAGYFPDKSVLKTYFRNDSNLWTAFNGTSMASPHVTGIVALMLQANPTLTAAQVREILINTATADANTGTVPNNRYGYGKVNAYAAVVKAINYLDINSFQSADLRLYPNPAGTSISLDLPYLYPGASIEVTGMDGRVLSQVQGIQLTGGAFTMDISSLEAGIYTIRLLNGGQVYVHKFIKI
jgi:minor extracellular serine protease Vpr